MWYPLLDAEVGTFDNTEASESGAINLESSFSNWLQFIQSPLLPWIPNISPGSTLSAL